MGAGGDLNNVYNNFGQNKGDEILLILDVQNGDTSADILRMYRILSGEEPQFPIVMSEDGAYNLSKLVSPGIPTSRGPTTLIHPDLETEKLSDYHEAEVTAAFNAANLDDCPHGGGTTPSKFALSITANNGSVNKSPSSSAYDSASVVNLTATAHSGYTFTGWSGSVSGSSNPTSVTMNSAKSVTAIFTKDEPVTIDTINPSPNLITFCDWEAFVDGYGSSVDTGSELISTGTATAQLTITGSDSIADEWAYGSLSAYLPEADTNNLRLVDYIKVTYSSDAAFNLSLPQVPLADEGTSYSASLPNTSGATMTVLLKVSEFIQPEWVATLTPLNLATITSIAFEIVSSYTGGSGTIAVSEVILYQYQGGSTTVTPIAVGKGIEANQALSVFVQSSQLKVVAPQSQRATVQLFSANGRRLMSLESYQLQAGPNAFVLPSSIGKGLVFLRIKGEGVSFSQSIMIW